MTTTDEASYEIVSVCGVYQIRCTVTGNVIRTADSESEAREIAKRLELRIV